MSMSEASQSVFVKDQIFEVEITDIGNDGEGIGKIDGYTLFIKDAVIGDRVKAKIMKAKKNYAYAHLEEIICPSKDRVEPPCPVARQCGGCQTQCMSYERELSFKQNKVRNNIVRLGGFDESFVDSVMHPVIGMDEPWRYRNKAQFPFGKDKKGNIIAGFYAGRTHSIIPVSDCLIGTVENRQILDIIIRHMTKNSVEPYDEASGRGLVRHVLIRKGFTSGLIMVCLVLNYQKAKNSKARKNSSPLKGEGQQITGDIYIRNQRELVAELSKVQGMTSISVSINTEKTNVIMGTEIHTIWGKDTIKDTLCGLEFDISPLSFYQVNPVQCEKLYGKAIEYAGLTGKETVWDLYCGIGTITLSMAKKAGHVYGIEIIPDAIEDAKKNAARNGLSNADFYCGKAEEVLPEFYGSKGSSYGVKAEGEGTGALHPDVIVVDPPRKGCGEKCLETMLKMAPGRIVYVSCDSATLARDLRILVDGGYELKAVTPCDMFSHTVHVETVVLLSKGEIPSKKVKVEFSLEGMDTDGFKDGATYDEIRDWVQEKEKEKEKEKAITEALKHFNMI